MSRQHIQSHVNPLLERGLVELLDNPHHKRSKLVALTGEGRRIVEEIDRREKPVVAALARRLCDEQLDITATTLAELRELLDDAEL